MKVVSVCVHAYPYIIIKIDKQSKDIWKWIGLTSMNKSLVQEGVLFFRSLFWYE